MSKEVDEFKCALGAHQTEWIKEQYWGRERKRLICKVCGKVIKEVLSLTSGSCIVNVADNDTIWNVNV